MLHVLFAQLCRSFPWSNGRRGRATAKGPAVFGVDQHVTAASRNQNVTILKMSMRPGQTWSSKLWTPCTNLAFVMCAVRGFLPGQGGPRIHLATRGSEITRNCRALAVEDGGVAWDECYITTQEYCTLTRACKNGHEVWSTLGTWNCQPFQQIHPSQ